MADMTLTNEEYQALLVLARQDKTPDMVRQIETFARVIDLRNGITRYLLNVQWQEAGQPLPPSAVFPTSWPPTLRALIELARPIAKVDVDALLAQRATKPVTVLVSPDPGGIVGWSPYETYFA